LDFTVGTTVAAAIGAVVVGTAVMVIPAVAAITTVAVTAGKDIQRPVRTAPWAITSPAALKIPLAGT
jgi:hypothetical protein